MRAIRLACLVLVMAAVGAGAESFLQTDWSGGGGVGGPVREVLNFFSTSSLADWSENPGELQLEYKVTPHQVDAAFAPASLQVVEMGGSIFLVAASAPAVGPHELAWWSNDGTLTTWTKHLIATYYGAQDVHAIDVDGDGDLDCVACSQAADRFDWFESVGGGFTQHNLMILDEEPMSVRGADLDGDGDIDVVGCLEHYSNVFWWENTDGSGTFLQHEIVDGAYERLRQVIPIDMDDDNDLDILVASSNGTAGFFWWENEGGAASWTKHVIATGHYTYSGAVADLDGDGDLDVVGQVDHTYGNGELYWAENLDGAGTSWSEHTIDTRHDGWSGPNGVRIADVDGDGDLDVLAGVSWDLAWYANMDGAGGDWSKHAIGSAGAKAIDVFQWNGATKLMAGVNGISWFDLDGFMAQGQLESSIFDPYLADPQWGTITWTADLPAGTEVAFEARAGDDWQSMGAWTAIPASGSDLSAYIGDGNRFIQYRVTLTTLTDPRLYSPILHAVTVDWAPPPTATPTPTPTGPTPTPTPAGTCAGQSDWSAGAGGSSPTLAWDDHFVASDSVSCSLFPGNLVLGSLARDPAIHRTVVPSCNVPYGVAVADFDRDGDDDVATSEILVGNQRISWWSNENGLGTSWTNTLIEAGFADCYHLQAHDMDGDGDADVLAANIGASLVWWENQSAGTVWIRHDISTALSGARQYGAADIDGDGDLDAFAAQYLSKQLTWFRNEDGAGTIWTPQQLPAGEYWEPWGMAAADMDHDGDIDLVATDRGSSSSYEGRVEWFENADGAGLSWTGHLIATDVGEVTEVHVGDLDGDKDLDVVASNTDEDEWWWGWFENQNGSWALHGLAGTAKPIPEFLICDFDGDRDLDLVYSERFYVSWLENLGTGTSWTRHELEYFYAARGVAVGDFNSNRTLDVVCANSMYYEVAWWEALQFSEEGWLTSCVLEVGQGQLWYPLEWTATEPLDTTVTVWVRASNDPLDLGDWQLVLASGDDLSDYLADGLRYVQYRIDMETKDTDFTPEFHEITLCWHPGLGQAVPAAGPLALGLLLAGLSLILLRRRT